MIVEGIESEATAFAAQERGIAFGQGYHFGRPADPRKALSPLLRAGADSLNFGRVFGLRVAIQTTYDLNN